VQSRIAAWIPRTAIVFGAGPIGLLQTLLLRIRDIEVFTVARRPANQTMASAIVAGCGATYLSTAELHIAANNVELPNIDVIVEASGSGDAVDAAMSLLGIGGVLVLLSITGGSREVSMPLDRINFEFVTGNKAMVGSVNSTVADFQAAITDLLQFEQRWPGLTGRMITHRLGSLDEAVDLMTTTRGAIKAVVDLT
jgi:threonine dehydrogenase-like Zn-dependent dehydrogenase